MPAFLEALPFNGPLEWTFDRCGHMAEGATCRHLELFWARVSGFTCSTAVHAIGLASDAVMQLNLRRTLFTAQRSAAIVCTKIFAL